MEKWKDIKGLEGYYAISNLGRVMNTRTQTIKTPSKKRTGYWKVQLSVKGVTSMHSIHRLVALHFIPNPLNLPQVDHLKGKDDNRAKSLRWCTAKENTQSHHRSRETPINAKGVYVYNLDNELLGWYITQAAAAEALGIHRVGVIRCLTGKRSSCKGYKFSLTKLT